MGRIVRIVVIGAVFAILSLSSVFAAGKERTFGVGFQASFPAWGLSGIVDLDRKKSIQGVLGLFGDLKIFTGRYLYRFKIDPRGYWNGYGYGSLGVWMYPYEEWDYWGRRWKKETETVLGLGGGVGLEYNWQALTPNLPPIWWNVEVGIAMVDFEEADYDVSAVLFGCGAHFRF